jgi:hypothetical protein
LKPRTRVYGHSIQVIDVPKDGKIEFARWKTRGGPISISPRTKSTTSGHS